MQPAAGPRPLPVGEVWIELDLVEASEVFQSLLGINPQTFTLEQDDWAYWMSVEGPEAQAYLLTGRFWSFTMNDLKAFAAFGKLPDDHPAAQHVNGRVEPRRNSE